MRNLHELDRFRRTTRDVLAAFGSFGDGTCGMFDVPHPKTAVTLKVIASAGGGRDHVSVSLPNRCPNWIEMDFIKRAFFKDDETAMQLHVPPTEHINYHSYCLHLWRPADCEIPRPPAEFVGPARTGQPA